MIDMYVVRDNKSLLITTALIKDYLCYNIYCKVSL